MIHIIMSTASTLAVQSVRWTLKEWPEHSFGGQNSHRWKLHNKKNCSKKGMLIAIGPLRADFFLDEVRELSRQNDGKLMTGLYPFW